MTAPPSKAPVAIGVLAGLLIVAVGGLGLAVWLMRAAPVAPPPPPAVTVATAPTISAPPAATTTPPAESAAPQASASAPPVGTAQKGAIPVLGVGTPGGKPKPGTGDGLSTNPYR